MKNVFLWIIQNKEWLFSGVGLFFISNIISFMYGKKVGINISGNQIINNYHLTEDNNNIDFNAGVQLCTGASGIEYCSVYDSLLVITAEKCELYIDNILIKTLNKETYSFYISDKQKFKIIYSGSLPKLTLYPTKKEAERAKNLYK